MKLEATCATDIYKVGHGPMYRRGTNRVNSNNTPRTDRIYRDKATAFYDGFLVVAGLQGGVQEIHELWQESFFDKPKAEVIDFYATLMTGVFGSRPLAVAMMAELHDIGYLPVEIKALAEGVKVPMGTPVFTITNTVDSAFWLVNYLETILSNSTWQPMTNATIAEEYFAIAEHFRLITGGDPFSVKVQMHDFSCRGMPGMEAAARSNFPHLWRFLGSDTATCLPYAVRYYDTPVDSLIMVSVPATEHAVTSSNILFIEEELLAGTYEFLNNEQFMIHTVMKAKGEPVRLIAEVMFVYELMEVIVPTGIVSNVSDTYDFWAMLTRGYVYLKPVIMRRQSNGITPGRLVVRPDSGDPVKIICGYNLLNIQEQPFTGIDSDLQKLGYDGVTSYGNHYLFGKNGERVEISEAEAVGAIETLWNLFDGEVNEKGYKVLNDHIGLIYGDSITTSRALEILTKLEKKGFASSCVVFGIGSYTYQCNTRDTFGFAVKATSTTVGEKRIAIFKAPKTDSGKNSAKGLLFVGKDKDGYFLIDNVSQEMYDSPANQLQTLYRDGVFLRRTNLAGIRERLEKN